MTVTHSGDDNHPTSNASAEVAIAKASLSITATVSVPIATLGQTSTLTVAGIPSDATGTVLVSSNGTKLCSITLPETSCTLSGTLAVGDYPLEVAYSGDDNYEKATTTATFAVVAVPHDYESLSAYPDDDTISVEVPSGTGITVSWMDRVTAPRRSWTACSFTPRTAASPRPTLSRTW